MTPPPEKGTYYAHPLPHPIVGFFGSKKNKNIKVDVLSILQRESGNATKNTRKKRHLLQKRKRNTCRYIGAPAYISKDD